MTDLTSINASSGRSPDWLQFENEEAPAVRREAEEDWRRASRVCLHSDIAKPLRVSFTGFRETDDGSRDCLPRCIVHAPVMEGLDGELNAIPKETQWSQIEFLPVKILSDWHRCRPSR